jgi:hypothetical protein
MLAENLSSRLTSAMTSLRSRTSVLRAGAVGSAPLQSEELKRTLSAVATPGRSGNEVGRMGFDGGS